MNLEPLSPTVTILFTDIENSTQLWEQHPPAMQAALAQHDRLLREVVEAHAGRVIKSTGDGCHAAFASASRAAAAVVAAQHALGTAAWPELPPPGLRVRMALHTGEAEVRAGDYYGPAVNRAARLLAIGHGGQILLSAVTAELVRDQLPPGASLVDLGQHHLKDLIRPEHVFQLTAPGLPSAFPPLRSLGVLLHNLPVQLTSFIGREQDLAEIRRLLATTHLLTLTGPGGTGKTRLALQLAAECLAAFPQGVWLIEFASLADPALVPQTVAAALGVREQPGQPLLDTLLDYLRPKRLLLLLDNCEHVISASAQLAARLLQACPQLRLLATSREALSVPGEAAYRVPSLSLADARQAAPDDLIRTEAVQLFVERAQAAQPSFRLTEHNLRAVAQICERLDGIPLALELAAARVKVFSPQQIAGRLDDRFRLLTGGSRTALERQQTLRALIDWSCDLLSEPERAAWRQLSVFAGGFTLDAAEAVLGAEALDWLVHLVDKSLVLVEEHEVTGDTRYRLLETIRQYGRDRLIEAGEASAARDHHLAYYLGVALAAEEQLNGPELVATLNRLDLEHDNFRAALAWALAPAPPTAVQIAASLKYFWLRRGYLDEGRQWLRDSLAQLDPGTDTRQQLRAKALLALGTIAFGQGELHLARESLEESVRLSRQAGDLSVLGEGLGMLGFVTVWLGDDTATETVLSDGLRLAHDTDQLVLKALLQAAHTQRAIRHQDFAAARAYGQTALELTRRLGNPWFLATALLGLGILDRMESRPVEARAHMSEAERLFLSIGDRHMVTAMQSERAHLERGAGHAAQAAALYRQTLPAYQELGRRAALLHDLECLAFIALTQGQAPRAARLLGAAEALRASHAMPMTAQEHDEYAEHLAALRAAIGAGDLAAAWAEGRALSLDDAVAYALA